MVHQTQHGLVFRLELGGGGLVLEDRGNRKGSEIRFRQFNSGPLNVTERRHILLFSFFMCCVTV